ncbi:MAG: hypothetical protein QW806_09845 [Nitrososphaerota archaeon]
MENREIEFGKELIDMHNIITKLKHDSENLHKLHDSLLVRVTNEEAKIIEIERKMMLIEQKLGNTETIVQTELREIKESLRKLQGDYFDLAKQISESIRNEVEKHLSKMDSYNKNNFDRIDKEINEMKSIMSKFLFLIVSTAVGVAFQLLLKIIYMNGQ